MRTIRTHRLVIIGLVLGFGASTAFAQCELDKLTASHAGKGLDRGGAHAVAWAPCLWSNNRIPC